MHANAFLLCVCVCLVVAVVEEVVVGVVVAAVVVIWCCHMLLFATCVDGIAIIAATARSCVSCLGGVICLVFVFLSLMFY